MQGDLYIDVGALLHFMN